MTLNPQDPESWREEVKKWVAKNYNQLDLTSETEEIVIYTHSNYRSVQLEAYVVVESGLYVATYSKFIGSGSSPIEALKDMNESLISWIKEIAPSKLSIQDLQEK